MTLLCAAGGPAAWADDQGGPGPSDTAAATSAKTWRRAKPARTPAGASLPREGSAPGASVQSAAAPALAGQTRYPGDVTFLGGKVVGSAQSHAIYLVNNTCNSPACWGNPENFLQHLGQSDMIHIADHYVGRSDPGRYTVGSNATIHHSNSGPLTDTDVVAIVHYIAARNRQSGYNHIYHVFLPPGQDECFDNTYSQCYSPDKPASFAFCAYHGSADTDIGHLLYTVEPFQAVPGCVDRPGTPNGTVVDSTADVLSHELFETVTDPDGDGWWNTGNLNELGSEIADECVYLLFVPNILDPNAVVYGDPAVVQLAGKAYAIQSEYSNPTHGCTVSAGPGGN